MQDFRSQNWKGNIVLRMEQIITFITVLIAAIVGDLSPVTLLIRIIYFFLLLVSKMRDYNTYHQNGWCYIFPRHFPPHMNFFLSHELQVTNEI